METKANYILIGAFTLAGVVGIVAMLLWFARIELDRQFDYYDVRFTSVSGLSEASDVRFSGLPVGQVVDVRLAPVRDGTILVRVEVDSATPVRTDSVATIEAQGVTGVSFVQIGPGTPEAAQLEPTEEMPVPEIEAGRSIIQSLSEDAPALIEETLQIARDLGEVLGSNQGRIERILRNVEDASATFATALEDFSNVAGSVSAFATEIGNFNDTLDSLSDDLEGLLQTSETSIASFGALSYEAETLLITGTETLEQAQGTIAATESFIKDDLSATTESLRTTVADLQTTINTVATDARGLIETFDATGTAATARLTEAEATLTAVEDVLARVSETATTIDGAAARFDRLLETEGAPLLSETRAAVADATSAIASISEVAQTDLPTIVEDIRTATATASRVIAQVGEDLSNASGRIDGLSLSAAATLSQITATFKNANITLDAIDTAVATGDVALAAAERAFSGADRVINEDIDGLITGLETSVASLNTAIAQVSDDIPEISQGLRSASTSAQQAFDGLNRVVGAAGPSITTFTEDGLPLFTRLADEARALIRNLDRLTAQIQRDPARFFLDRQTPEYQR
ncbi:MCE family protein [Thalassorhabdomicrobium marinisediminis]|uniref:MCE family protein n=1 Tax=Thalassorhabdomicrobium marinisediminis TaxID=2170577 RepID=UPI00248F9B0F|nr:MlaD family protein [Thalassorhabdomicrobium marinisediminis]